MFCPQPLKKIPLILRLSSILKKSALENLKAFEKTKHNPSLLKKTIGFSLVIHTEEQSEINSYLEQCTLWKVENPTQEQFKAVTQIEKNYLELKEINQLILDILYDAKWNLVEQIEGKKRLW